MALSRNVLVVTRLCFQGPAAGHFFSLLEWGVGAALSKLRLWNVWASEGDSCALPVSQSETSCSDFKHKAVVTIHARFDRSPPAFSRKPGLHMYLQSCCGKDIPMCGVSDRPAFLAALCQVRDTFACTRSRAVWVRVWLPLRPRRASAPPHG